MTMDTAFLGWIKCVIFIYHLGPVIPVTKDIAGSIAINQIIHGRDGDTGGYGGDLHDLEFVIIVFGPYQTIIPNRKVAGTREGDHLLGGRCRCVQGRVTGLCCIKGKGPGFPLSCPGPLCNELAVQCFCEDR